MLNRMMFVSTSSRSRDFWTATLTIFSNRLSLVRQQNGGSGRFQDFYREFLLRLFHEGLGTA